MPEKYQINAELRCNNTIKGDYRKLELHAPEIAASAQPGQFMHVKLPGLEHRILRRPFSICDADLATGMITIVYKVVGEGTAHLATIQKAGTVFNLLGPLGKSYELPDADERFVIVAGGYGCAATYLLAKKASVKPLVLIGGRSSDDILLVDEYQALGCDVRIATNDGSQGRKGFVTELLKDCCGNTAMVAACGPNPMLKAVSDMILPLNIPLQISLDHPMCCGIGACFACVVKVRDNASPDGWRFSRSCLEGPVYDAREVVWD